MSWKTMTTNDLEMPLMGHLRELRSRLIKIAVIVSIGAGLCLLIAPTLFAYLTAPLIPHLSSGSTFVALGLTEAWLVYFQVAFIAGSFVTAPLWLYHVWAFMAPGLVKRERRFLFILGFTSALCFFAGGAFCYFVIMPYGFGFLVRLLADSGVTLMPQMNLYLSLALRLLFAFGIIFELPIVVVLLVRWGLVELKTLCRGRRHMVVAAFIVGAILTPTVDIVNQTLLALPLILLYELGLTIARFQQPKT